MAKTKRIFIVDDDPTHNDMLKAYLLDKFNVEVMAFTNGEDAIRNLHLNPEFVILDFYLDRSDSDAMNGIDVLKRIKETNPQCYVLMLSGQDKIDVAVETMKHGAFDYVVKNPTGFIRVENSLNNLHKTLRDKYLIKAYKTSTFILLGVIFIIIVTAIVLKQAGIATDNLGWW
jgi:DNA-binding NtrC family response regulator